jgi:hypothetical protein
MGLEPSSIEAVFINHKVQPKNTLLKEGDRVALLPPGTPGSYRLILGIKESKGVGNSQVSNLSVRLVIHNGLSDFPNAPTNQWPVH